MFTQILELFIVNLSSRIIVLWEILFVVFWDHQVLFVIIGSPSCNFLFALCLALCLPFCVEVWVVYSRFVSYNSSVKVSLWKVFGGHNRNLSVWRRGQRAVAQTSKHIILFVFGSLNSQLLYFTLLLLLISIHAWYCLCAHTCV